MKELKQQAIRGGLAKACAQAVNFGLRTGSVMILGRLLEPRDFGLVAMVTAITGVFHLLKDFGLSAATVQRSTVTQEQQSTLFWVNMLLGALLALLTLAAAPLIAAFYHEPRLFPVAAILSLGFLINAAGVQHDAHIQRQLRFATIAAVETAALVASVATGVGMALMGYGYWSLVCMTIVTPSVTTIGYWMMSGWIPGRPCWDAEVLSLLRFGGTLTLNGLIVYVAYNLEKVLLGRLWGAAALGLYTRAYQLINIPTENLNSAAGGVAFPALARVQDDPVRLRRYFLKGYSLVVSMTLPITIVCALFADDLIRVLVGPKWSDAVPVFRLLAPTVSIFALINPLGWLMFATGMVGRSLRVALVLAPLVIFGYIAGLPYGPKGVAFGYSLMMTLWVVPHIAWCIRGTVISLRDVFTAVSRPLIAALVAAILPIAWQLLYGQPALSPLLRLLLGCGSFLAVYVAMLLLVMGQTAFYRDLFRTFIAPLSNPEPTLVSQ